MSARWVSVRTGAGYHVRLIGANGEPIMTSEPYVDPRSVSNAVSIAQTADDETGPDHDYIDERIEGGGMLEEPPPAVEEPELEPVDRPELPDPTGPLGEPVKPSWETEPLPEEPTNG